MPTVTYKNAKVYVGGYDLSGDFNQLELMHEAESLDATVFGNDTRRRRGGLHMTRLTGGGFWQAGTNAVDPALFESHGLDDTVEDAAA